MQLSNVQSLPGPRIHQWYAAVCGDRPHVFSPALSAASIMTALRSSFLCSPASSSESTDPLVSHHTCSNAADMSHTMDGQQTDRDCIV